MGGWICVYVCVVRACEYEGFLTAMISEEESVSVDASELSITVLAALRFSFSSAAPVYVCVWVGGSVCACVGARVYMRVSGRL